MQIFLKILFTFSSIQAFANISDSTSPLSEPPAVEQFAEREKEIQSIKDSLLEKEINSFLKNIGKHFIGGYTFGEFASPSKEVFPLINRQIEKIARRALVGSLINRQIKQINQVFNPKTKIPNKPLDSAPIVQALHARNYDKFYKELQEFFSPLKSFHSYPNMNLPFENTIREIGGNEVEKMDNNNYKHSVLWLLTAKTKKGETFLQLIEKIVFSDSPEDKFFSKTLIQDLRYFLADFAIYYKHFPNKTGSFEYITLLVPASLLLPVYFFPEFTASWVPLLSTAITSIIAGKGLAYKLHTDFLKRTTQMKCYLVFHKKAKN